MSRSPVHVPTRSRFIKVKYEGVIELSEEQAGIAPTLNLTSAVRVLKVGMDSVLPGTLRVVSIYGAKYHLALHEDPTEKKRAPKRR